MLWTNALAYFAEATLTTKKRKVYEIEIFFIAYGKFQFLFLSPFKPWGIERVGKIEEVETEAKKEGKKEKISYPVNKEKE